MFIPGTLIALLTFPGVMVHELAHKLFCQWTGTRVLEVCYFQFENPVGYVIHEIPSNAWKHILIGVGPLFVNSILGFAIGMMAPPLRQVNGPGALLPGLVTWLALSIAMHSFPSTGDAQGIWNSLWARPAPITARLFGTPLVGVIYLGAIGSMVWLDAIYGFGVAVALPELLYK